jgi:hypothetical protein
MRVTVNIPNPLYRKLMKIAASGRCSVEELILRGLGSDLYQPTRKPRKPIVAPIIKSGRPGTWHLGNGKIFEIISFP